MSGRKSNVAMQNIIHPLYLRFRGS